MKLQFCELLEVSDKSPSTFTPRLEREAVITVSWMQAKEIARLLGQVVTAYEELNHKLPSPADIKVP